MNFFLLKESLPEKNFKPTPPNLPEKKSPPPSPPREVCQATYLAPSIDLSPPKQEGLVSKPLDSKGAVQPSRFENSNQRGRNAGKRDAIPRRVHVVRNLGGGGHPSTGYLGIWRLWKFEIGIDTNGQTSLSLSLFHVTQKIEKEKRKKGDEFSSFSWKIVGNVCTTHAQRFEKRITIFDGWGG